MADIIKGITIEFKGEIVDLENSISKLNTAMKALKSESSRLNKELKLDPSNTKALESAIKNLQQQQKILNQELDNYKSSLDDVEAGSQEWLNIQKKIEGVEKALDTVNRKMDSLNSWKADQINKEFEKLGKKLQSIGNVITNIGNALMPFSVAFGGALVGATTTAVEFEDAFTGVAKTVDATEDELATLRQGIIELSKDIPSSTKEISAVAESAGQLGIATGDILEFTETMIGLGNATNLTSDEASSMIAQFANVIDINGEYEKFASALVELGNNGASTEADIMALAQRLSGAGSVAGLTAQEILGLASSMANVGINAEAGGTAMSTLISQMERAVVEGGSDLQGLAQVSGLTAKEFADAWETEPSQAIDAFLSGLNAIQAQGGNVYGTLETLGITEKRLTDTVLRLSSAQGEVSKNTEMANKAWKENVALSTETEKRYSNTKSTIEKLKNSISAIGITLGNVLLPILNDMLNTITPVVQGFASMSPTMQKVIVAVLAIGTALGPLVVILGKVVSSVGVLTSAIGASGLGASLSGLLGPVGAVVTAFVAIWNSSETFRKSIQTLMQSIITGLSPTLQALWQMLQNLWTSLQTYIMPILTQIGNFLGTYIIPIIQQIWTWIATYVLPIINSLASLLTGAFSGALEAVSSLFKGLIDLLSEVFSWLGDIWAWLEDTYVWELFGEVIGGISEAISVLVGWIQSLVEWLTTAIAKVGEFLSGVAEIAGSAWDGITSIIGGVFGSGGYGSGGYASGAIALTTNITVNTNREITQDDTKSWALQMVDVINEELGKRL